MTIKTLKKIAAQRGHVMQYATRDVGHGECRGWWLDNSFYGQRCEDALERIAEAVTDKSFDVVRKIK